MEKFFNDMMMQNLNENQGFSAQRNERRRNDRLWTSNRHYRGPKVIAFLFKFIVETKCVYEKRKRTTFHGNF